MFFIILAFASDDRAATVDAICEFQTSWAIFKIYILVSTATRRWNTGNLLIGVSSTTTFWYYFLWFCFFTFVLPVLCLYIRTSCFPCSFYYFFFFLLLHILFLNAIDVLQYEMLCFQFQNCISKELLKLSPPHYLIHHFFLFYRR